MTHNYPLTGRTSRRQFLTRTALLAGAGCAVPLATDLAFLANTASATDDPAYRALVCVFLYGGNDSMSTFVPSDDSSYAKCRALRPTLTPPRESLLRIGGDGQSSREIGFASQLSGMKALYDNDDLSIIANVGPMSQPMTKELFANVRNRPPQLFSHNDQQSMWQSSKPEGSTEGWGGRLGDLLLEDNGEQNAFTCISTTGHAVMMSGRNAGQYQVDPSGITELFSPFRSGAILDGLRDVMGQEDSTLFGSAYAEKARSSLRAADILASVVPEESVGLPSSPLGQQLDMVARLIAAGQGDLGLKRQVFFVGVAGFDTHAKQNNTHPGSLLDLDLSLSSFHSHLRTLGLADSVTTFTASEFGRTISENGNGTDHGWGAHHVLMGGAVAGGRIIGTLPEIADDGPDDVGRGRLIPTVAVDQYSAALGRWMGVAEDQVRDFVPGVDRFERLDVGLSTGSSETGAKGGGSSGGQAGGQKGAKGGGRSGGNGGGDVGRNQHVGPLRTARRISISSES